MVCKIRIVLYACLLVLLPAIVCGSPQEARVNQKKIENDRAKKNKKARKDYEVAVKRHLKMQSKTTKASMKKTKKAAGKATPSRH